MPGPTGLWAAKRHECRAEGRDHSVHTHEPRRAPLHRAVAGASILPQVMRARGLCSVCGKGRSRGGPFLSRWGRALDESFTFFCVLEIIMHMYFLFLLLGFFCWQLLEYPFFRKSCAPADLPPHEPRRSWAFYVSFSFCLLEKIILYHELSFLLFVVFVWQLRKRPWRCVIRGNGRLRSPILSGWSWVLLPNGQTTTYCVLLFLCIGDARDRRQTSREFSETETLFRLPLIIYPNGKIATCFIPMHCL